MAEYGSLGRRPGVPYQARGGQEQGQKSSAARALLRAHLGDVGYVDAGSFGVLLTSRPLDDAIQTLLALGSADLRPHNHEAARRPQEFRFAMDARARGSSDGRGHRSLSRGEVVMPIRVVAKGRVTEGPSQLVGEESSVVFVLDPFPDPSGACLAHASEVVCPSHDLASTALETVQWGDLVEVTGVLVTETVSGPIEDDLSAVRAWIQGDQPGLDRRLAGLLDR